MKNKPKNAISLVAFLCLENVSVGYFVGKKPFFVQQRLNLSALKGELIALIGNNGCGKSTLLRSIAHLQPLLSGKIFIENKNVADITPNERARLISIVLTGQQAVASFTVRELVAIGRDPYTGWLGNLSATDESIIDWSIEMTNVKDFENRTIHELSDGERQRVFIARALAQDTPLILLDEPTSHLDLSNRVNILLLLQKLAHETGKIILISTHELETAMQVADKIWLMQKGKGIIEGSPEDLIINGTFNEAFKDKAALYRFDSELGVFVIQHNSGGKVKFLPSKEDKLLDKWTLKALRRRGFAVSNSAHVEVRPQAKQRNWLVLSDGKSFIANTISEMLDCVNKLINTPFHYL